jgi:hypothetical protein
MRRATLIPLLIGLGFAALMSLVALAYLWFVVFQPGGNASSLGKPSVWDVARFFALPLLPAAALSWWIAIAGAHRPGALRGALSGASAGLLTVALGELSVAVALFAQARPPGMLTQVFVIVVGFVWLAWSTTPQGLGAAGVAIVTGALYGVIGRPYLVITPPTPDPAQS